MRQTLVAVLTGQADPVNVLRGLQAGADGFMTKSSTAAEIVARLKQLLARGSRPPLTPATEVRVSFLGQQFDLTSSRDQLLNVLLGAFEDVVALNDRYKQELGYRKRAEQALR